MPPTRLPLCMATVTNLDLQPGMLHSWMAELRSTAIQQDRQRFRHNLQRIGFLLAYEISRTLAYTPSEVTTPLGSLQLPQLPAQPVLVSILRAALPMQEGFLQVYDQADCGFVAAYRNPLGEEAFEISVDYSSCPNLAGRCLMLLDPMIATGRSMVACYRQLGQYGQPAQLYVAGLIASSEGLHLLQRQLPPHTHIYVAAIDDELTAKSYIVPGLGDAGDLAFGSKEIHS